MLAFTGAASLCCLTTPSAHAASTSREEFDFQIECDPLHAEGSGSSGYVAMNHRAENRLGLRPPKCELKGTQAGGSFACECADGSKSDGSLSATDTLNIHQGILGGFEWCENKVEEVCGALTTPVESICENEHGVCAITAYSRIPGQAFSELEQTCECYDDRTWLASTPTISSFKFDQATLDETCKAEVARCAPEKSEKQASSAIELPKEILSYPKALGCMNSNGRCRVYSDQNNHWTDCQCFIDENEGFGVEAPWPLETIHDMLVVCKEEILDCPDFDVSEPEDEPEDEAADGEEDKDSDAGPGCPGSEGDHVKPKPDAFPVGCAVNASSLGGRWGLLALAGLGLIARRRRRPNA